MRDLTGVLTLNLVNDSRKFSREEVQVLSVNKHFPVRLPNLSCAAIQLLRQIETMSTFPVSVIFYKLSLFYEQIFFFKERLVTAGMIFVVGLGCVTG